MTLRDKYRALFGVISQQKKKGKNLFNPVNMRSGTRSTSTGNYQSDPNATTGIKYIPCKPNTDYVWTIPSNIRMYFYDANKVYLSTQATTTTKRYLTTPSNCYYFNYSKGTPLATMLTYQIQVEEGREPTPFEPYVE